MKKIIRTDAKGMVRGVKHPPKTIEFYVAFIGSGNFDDYITDNGDIVIGKVMRDIEDGVIKVEW